MDWAKAKNIILITLIVTNLFIMGMYGIRYEKNQGDNDSAYQYTINVLEENDIYIDCDIPERTGRMTALTVSYGKYDENVVKGNMDRIKVLSESERTDEGYGDAADRFIEKCGYQEDGTRRISVEESDDGVIVLYKNYYRNIPLEECYMTVKFRDGEITGFDRKWMEVVETGDSRIDVMSPLSALLNFMSEMDTEDEIRITDMYITYWIDSYDVNSNILYDTALPAWCICYNEGQIKYISAIMQ